jgi:hypothetical protein
MINEASRRPRPHRRLAPYFAASARRMLMAMRMRERTLLNWGVHPLPLRLPVGETTAGASAGVHTIQPGASLLR